MKLFYKIMLTFNSVVLMLFVYLIKEHCVIPFSTKMLKCECVSYFLYAIVLLLFSMLCLWLTRFLSKDSIEVGIQEIELANNSYLPTYLGYFFVALSVNDTLTMVSVFIIVFVFTFNSQTLFFNPMFLLFGYRFYLVTINDGMKIFLISKKEIKNKKKLKFNAIARINDYTYIDEEE